MQDNPIELPQILDGENKSSPFVNRIRKNYRHIRKWAKRSDTNCFRIFDREIHQYPIAIDFYAGRFCIHYYSKSRDNDEPPQTVVDEVTQALKSIFGTNPDSIYWRTRAKTKTTRQYEKIGESKEFFPVIEYGVKFWVNLLDYLDTGLFLDHRETRKLVASQSEGKRVLNLFSYTASFSVHAAAAGAAYTKSVDMSNTYTAWAKDNFTLNSLSFKNNEIVRADCMTFLEDEVRSGVKYDIIIIDPPTISRSKKMEQMFDVQVDYVSLISGALKLLAKDGVIFFSTNSRKFVFETGQFPTCTLVDISGKTIPIDFHDPKTHRCWKITKE